MNNCKVVYPHRLVRPLGKYRGINGSVQLKLVIDDILHNGKNIDAFVGDNPKRSKAKKVLSHASYFPCEYCFARGVATCVRSVSKSARRKQLALEKKIVADKLKTEVTEAEKKDLQDLQKSITKMQREEIQSKKSRITWPYSTANAEKRTPNKVLEIIDNLHNLTPHDRKGIVGRSDFFDIPGFDYVHDCPAEYLHLVCLGVVKRTVSLTFAVGEVRPRKTKRPLSDPSLFNEFMSSIKTPKGFSRRARDMDFAVLKAAEFRNYGLFFFPIILECIEEGEGEREIWLNLAYMMRACVLPNHEYNEIDENVVDACCHTFYKQFEKIFGVLNCSYSIHVAGSHLREIRGDRPLTERSSFIFENFYGEMKQCFVPGTGSPLKQIMEKVYLKRALAPHCCELPIYLSDHETSLENDTLFYIWENNRHNMYVIKEILNDEEFICNKINTEPACFEETEMNWGKVGVYEMAEIEDEEIVLNKNDVSGKVLKVLDYVITCPNNVLREK